MVRRERVARGGAGRVLMRITKEVVDEVVRLRAAGRSIRKLAKEVGVSDWSVKRILRENQREQEPVAGEWKSARVVKIPKNDRLVLAEVAGAHGLSRVIVKPDLRKRMGVGTKIRRVEKISDGLYRMVGIS